MHGNKIAIIIRDDLKTWQKLNVTAFLAGAVAIEFPALHGASLVTASGNRYMPFFRQPVLIYKAENADQIARAFTAQKKGSLVSVFMAPVCFPPIMKLITLPKPRNTPMKNRTWQEFLFTAMQKK